MPVRLPGGYGVIALRNARTKSFIARQLLRWADAPYGTANHDEHLVAFRLAANLIDLQDELRVLQANGAVLGTDYAVTDPGGVVGPVPAWLHTTYAAPTQKSSAQDRGVDDHPKLQRYAFAFVHPPDDRLPSDA
jgi:hypothetical protein